MEAVILPESYSTAASSGRSTFAATRVARP